MCRSICDGQREKEDVEQIVCYSDYKYLPHRLLIATHQFSEAQSPISDCERCYFCPCFGKSDRDQNSASLHKSPSVIGPRCSLNKAGIAGRTEKGEQEWRCSSMMLLTLSSKKDHLPYLRGNLSCKLAFESKLLIFLHM